MNSRPQNPGRDRLLDLMAIAFVALGCVALGLASRQWVLVGIPGVLAVSRPFVGRRLVIAPKPIVYLGIILGLLLLARFRPVTGVSASLGFNIPFHVSVGLLVAAAGRLYSRQDPQRLPHVLLAGTLAIAAAGTDCGPTEYRIIVALAALPIVVLLRGSMQSERLARGRLGVKLACLALPLAVVVALTHEASEVWRVSYNDMDAAFLARFRDVASPKAGFSGTAHLGSIPRLKGDGGHEIALRAFGVREPGYLRGKVFVEYDAGDWHAPLVGQEITADRQEETDTSGRVTLPGHPAAAADQPAAWSVVAEPRYAGHYFLPLETQTLAMANPVVTVFPGGACESPGGLPSYDVFLDARPPVTGATDPANSALPKDPIVLQTLDATIAKLKPRDATVGEAVRAIARHFAQHYAYEVGIHFEPNEEPMVAFLTRCDHGHCELFASAGVLLLRRMGFPARYVTGFVCNEKSVVGDVWIARQEQAHAWVEAFDPTTGWFTAELTPEDGRPHPVPATGASALVEWLKAQGKRFWTAAKELGPLGAIRWVGAWLLARWYRATGLALVAFVAAWRRQRGRRVVRAAAHVSLLPPGLASDRERLVALERRLARDGLGRSAGETLLEYASRVGASEHPARGEAVAFLRDYGARRYAPFVS